jgi:hypothetical protein
MPASMAVEAAGYFASADRLAEKDLVDLLASEQKKAIAQAAASASAPAELRGKSEAEAMTYLEDQKAKRAKLQARVGELQKQREAELAKDARTDAFDETVVESLKERAAAAGIKY